jgi:hypothetical protein
LRHEDHEDRRAILPTSPTTASRGKPLQAVTRRQFTKNFKQTVTTIAACKTSSESSSSGRGADNDDKEITGTGEENIEGIDEEEEEEENPLP